MAKQRFVNTYFWNDPFILRLAPDEKLLFLWALTNPQTDLCGAYEVALEKIAFEVKLKEQRIEQIFSKFEEAGKMLYRDGWVLIKNFSKHQQGRSPKVQQGAKRSLEACPTWVRHTLCQWSAKTTDSVSPETADSFQVAENTDLTIDYAETMEILSAPRPRLRPDGQPNGQRERESAIADVFEFWKETLGHERTQLDKKRASKIRARLNDGFTVEQLKAAILGNKASAFHQGDNGNGTVYDSIDLIFRDAEKVEQFIRCHERVQSPIEPDIPQWKKDRDACPLCDADGLVWDGGLSSVCGHGGQA